MRRVAALFVETGGAYFGLEGVDPWDVKRDARLYAGPDPVVAHPPCQRWGRYWFGGPSAKTRKALGDDGGCFVSALKSVRTFGGVLEHPEASHAFRIYGLGRPKWREGWIRSADGLGWICCVAQGNYGHRSRKLTWLYYVGPEKPPDFDWSIPPSRVRMDQGFHSVEERVAARREQRIGALARLSKRERAATPPGFRDLLLNLARLSRP